jgi:elongation factor G
MGDVIGDINKRRGRVLGMNPAENRKKEIIAVVPVSEMGDFPTAMRSIAQGRAVFDFKLERYEEAPPFVAQKVISEKED